MKSHIVRHHKGEFFTYCFRGVCNKFIGSGVVRLDCASEAEVPFSLLDVAQMLFAHLAYLCLRDV